MVANRVFDGKDLDEALHAASSALGVDEPELDYEILEPGRRGLFGVGTKRARIRVMPAVETLSDEHIQQGIEPTPEPRAESRAGSSESRQVAETVQRMLDLLGLDIRIEPQPSESGVSLELDGPDQKRLTRKDGEVLSALQFVVNRMARRTWPDAGRIQLSCNGSRKGRDDDVVELVREVAQQVRNTGTAKRLHPMNAYERRLVHVTVREFSSLGSRSEGNGYLKRVRIYKQ